MNMEDIPALQMVDEPPTDPNDDGTVCQLNVHPFQCCCTCIHHLPVHYHCCTDPQPTEEEKAMFGVTGRCVCAVRKGWACVMPDGEHTRVLDNWGMHSCGCENHTPRQTPPVQR